MTLPRSPDELGWKLNPNVRAFPFAGSGGGQHLLELDDADGRTQRTVVSAAVFAVLQRLREPSQLDALLSELGAEGWSRRALDNLRVLVEGDCRNRKLLIDASHESSAAPPQLRRPGYMSFLCQLLPAPAVNRIAPLLSWLFSTPGLVLGVLASALGKVLLVAALIQPHSLWRAPSSIDILLGVALGLVVVLLHELGHASAAWRLGARRVSIGVGWYVCFPVAYADLSEIWRLPVRQRALIDLAGVYMQALAVLILMLLHHGLGNQLYLVAATAASLSILWNMNPLLRMDGYWLLSDLLGATRLRSEAFTALHHVLQPLLPAGWRGAAATSVPTRQKRMLIAMAGYALLSGAFFVLVVTLGARRFFDGIMHAIPGYFRSLLDAPWQELGVADVVVLIGGTAWHLLLFAFLGRFLFSLLPRLLLGAGKAWRRWRGGAATVSV